MSITHKYRITLPLGTYTYAKNGVELDQVIANCTARGCTPNQLNVEVISLIEDGINNANTYST